MRPRGPLSPRVYWTRRVLVIALLVVVALLVWWAMPGGGSGASANPEPGGTSPAVNHPASTPSTGSGAGTGQGSGQHTPKTPPRTSHTPGGTTTSGPTHTTTPATPPTTTTPTVPLTSPTGACDPTTVRLALSVDSIPTGYGTTVKIAMSTSDGSTCSLGLRPSLLVAKITSGIATVWQSGNCPDALPAKNVVVRPEPGVVYSFRWNGRVSPYGCTADRVADPGTYWAHAALVGGQPRQASFVVTEPNNPA